MLVSELVGALLAIQYQFGDKPIIVAGIGFQNIVGIEACYYTEKNSDIQYPINVELKVGR